MFDIGLQGPIARLTLSRPEARNAVPASGWGELARAARQASEAARVLIVQGDGSAFCAGADLFDFAAFEGDPDAGSAFREAMRVGLDTLAALPIATIALVEGPCFGAGVALAMACDIRVAGPSARFAITPAKLGISYPQEDVARLVALVGAGQASRLLLSAQGIDAAEAVRIGLADLVSEHAREAADDLALAIAGNDASSVATLKRGIRLAAAGVRSDSGQDQEFDRLLGCERLAGHLAALRTRRG
jgi:enoyl-CoA hydratase